MLWKHVLRDIYQIIYSYNKDGHDTLDIWQILQLQLYFKQFNYI